MEVLIVYLQHKIGRGLIGSKLYASDENESYA
jgi:hypothetical protein